MRLKRTEWEVRNVSVNIARQMVEEFHYAGSASNTYTYLHGLFPVGSFWEADCVGVAWWIPPTKGAAVNTYPKNWQGVLALSRLVVTPGGPGNSCSFLIGASMRLIDRQRWPCLLTYADTWQDHSGGIYKATNWQQLEDTIPQRVYTLNGRLFSRKRGPRTYTHSEMIAMGARLEGRFSKHKFVHYPK